MVLRVGTVRRLGPELETLTDDVELTVRLVLEGQIVHWNPWAVTYDEKPVTLTASLLQRLRWAQGDYWLLGRYGPALVGRFVGRLHLAALDMLLFLLSPLVRAGLGGLVQAGRVAVAAAVALFVLSAYQAVAGASAHRGRLALSYAKDAASLAWFGLTWATAVFIAPFRAGDQHRWVKTDHSRGLRLAEVTGGTAFSSHTRRTRSQATTGGPDGRLMAAGAVERRGYEALRLGYPLVPQIR